MKKIFNTLLTIITISSFTSYVISCSNEKKQILTAHSVTGLKLDAKSNISSVAALQNFVLISKSSAIYVAPNGSNFAYTSAVRTDSGFKDIKGYYNQERYILVAGKYETGIEILTTDKAKNVIYDYQYKYNYLTNADSVISSKDRIWFLTRPTSPGINKTSHIYFINKSDLNYIPLTNKTGNPSPIQYKPPIHEVYNFDKKWGDANLYINKITYSKIYDEIFISTNQGCYYIKESDLYNDATTHYNTIIHSLNTMYKNYNADNSPFIKIQYDPTKTTIKEYKNDIQLAIMSKLANVGKIWTKGDSISILDSEKNIKVNIPINHEKIWKNLKLELKSNEKAPTSEKYIYENILFYKDGQNNESIKNKINKNVYLKFQDANPNSYTLDNFKNKLKSMFDLTDNDINAIKSFTKPNTIQANTPQKWTITIQKNGSATSITKSINVIAETSGGLLKRINNTINSQKNVDYLNVYEVSGKKDIKYYDSVIKASIRDLCNLTSEEVRSISIATGQTITFSGSKSINISSNLTDFKSVAIKIKIDNCEHYALPIYWENNFGLKSVASNKINAISKIFLDDLNHIIWCLTKDNQTEEQKIIGFKQNHQTDKFEILKNQPYIHLNPYQVLKNIIFYKDNIIIDVYDTKNLYGDYYNSYVGLMKYIRTNNNITKIQLEKSILTNKENYNNIFLSSRHNLWVGTNSNSAFYIKLDNELNKYYRPLYLPIEANIRGFVEATNKDVWLYTTNNGVWRISL